MKFRKNNGRPQRFRLARRLFVAFFVLLLIYVLSIGPVSRWVTAPIANDRSLQAFTIYDRRLNAYYRLYDPLRRLVFLDPSYTAFLYLERYELLWTHPFAPSFEGFKVTNQTVPAIDFVAEPSPTAVDLMSRLRDMLQINPERGYYAFYLPRTHRLIVHMKKADADLVMHLDSDPW